MSKNIQLSKSDANLTRVTLGSTTFWFSYETVVAINTDGNTYVSENQWSASTGKHLSAIDGGSKEAKARRLPHENILNIIDNVTEGL